MRKRLAFGLLLFLSIVGFNGARAQRLKSLAYQMSSGFEEIVPDVKEEFSCDDREYGYYADLANNCQIFHICNPPNQHFSFFCPNTTIFDQKLLVCNNEDVATPCQESEKFYALNSNFGVIDNNALVEVEASK